jgi:hypothetical protein
MTIPHCVSSADEVLAIIHEHNARWQQAQRKST